MKKNRMSWIATTSFAVIAGLLAKLYGGTQKDARKQKERADKMEEYYSVLNYWLHLKQKKKSLTLFFSKAGYKTVAIYGMKEMGERLYDELCESEIDVKYGIDQNADQIYAAIDVVTMEDTLEPVDVIVVTASYYYEEIEKKLKEKTDADIVSLEDVVFSL